MKLIFANQVISKLPSQLTGMVSFSVDSAISALEANGCIYSIKNCPSLLDEDDSELIKLLSNIIPENSLGIYAENLNSRFIGMVYYSESKQDFIDSLVLYNASVGKSFFTGDILIFSTSPFLVVGFHHEGDVVFSPDSLQSRFVPH